MVCDNSMVHVSVTPLEQKLGDDRLYNDRDTWAILWVVVHVLQLSTAASTPKDLFALGLEVTSDAVAPPCAADAASNTATTTSTGPPLESAAADAADAPAAHARGPSTEDAAAARSAAAGIATPGASWTQPPTSSCAFGASSAPMCNGEPQTYCSCLMSQLFCHHSIDHVCWQTYFTQVIFLASPVWGGSLCNFAH